MNDLPSTSPYTANILRNSFYNIVGEAIRLGLFLAAIPLLIQILGADKYGLWKLVLTTVNFITVAEAGLSITTTVYVSHDLANNSEENLSQTISITLGLMFALATAVSLIVIWTASDIVLLFSAFDSTQQQVAAIAIRIGSLVIWSKLIQQVLIGLIQAHERFDILNIMQIAQSIIIYVGLVIVAWQTHDVRSMMKWYAIASLIILSLYFAVSKRVLHNKRVRWQWKWQKVRIIGQYSILVWLTELGGRLFTQIDRLIVAALLGSHALTVYSAITDVSIQINMLSALPVKPLLPRLGNFFATQQQRSNKIDNILVKEIRGVLELNALLALSIGFVLFVWANQIVRIILPNVENPAAVLSLRVVVVIYSMYSINAVGYYILFGIGKLKISLLTQLISGVGSLALIWLGARRYGLIGVSAGNIGYLGVWLLTIFAMRALTLPAREWLQWLAFPIIWFVSAIILVGLIDGENLLMLGVFITFLITFAGWFIKRQYHYLQLAIQRVFYKTRSR